MTPGEIIINELTRRLSSEHGYVIGAYNKKINSKEALQIIQNFPENDKLTIKELFTDVYVMGQTGVLPKIDIHPSDDDGNLFEGKTSQGHYALLNELRNQGRLKLIALTGQKPLLNSKEKMEQNVKIVKEKGPDFINRIDKAYPATLMHVSAMSASDVLNCLLNSDIDHYKALIANSGPISRETLNGKIQEKYRGLAEIGILPRMRLTSVSDKDTTARKIVAKLADFFFFDINHNVARELVHNGRELLRSVLYERAQELELEVEADKINPTW